MTADVVELVIYLLQLLAGLGTQADGKLDSRPSTRWSPWLIAGSVVGGLGLLGLVGYWSALGRPGDPAIPLLGLLLGTGCLGLAAWMADETDLAGSQSASRQMPKRAKKERDSAWDEL